MTDNMDRYELANLRRQAILDVVVAHPHATSPVIRNRVVGVPQADVGKTLTRMVRRGEIAISGKVLIGKQHIYTYVALRERCIPAAECMGVMTEKMLRTQGKTPKIRVEIVENKSGNIAPGHYRNYAGSLPKGNSGGQGGIFKPRMHSRTLGS